MSNTHYCRMGTLHLVRIVTSAGRTRWGVRVFLIGASTEE